MSNDLKNKSKQKDNKEEDKKKHKPTYWERVIKGKGTVAEPWPTAEELWNDPKVRKIIKDHHNLIKKERKS